MDLDDTTPPSDGVISVQMSKFKLITQKILDDVTPWLISRWCFSAFFTLVYILRVWYLSGFYIITYALGIYLLNLLIGFLSPQIDPEFEENSEDPALLPTASNDEFKPFIRRLPEFKFWLSLTRAILIALFCTFFPFLDVPVFWPVLLLYFIALFTVTMKKQIKHMYTHKYLPFTRGKPTYKGSQ